MLVDFFVQCVQCFFVVCEQYEFCVVLGCFVCGDEIDVVCCVGNYDCLFVDWFEYVVYYWIFVMVVLWLFGLDG